MAIQDAQHDDTDAALEQIKQFASAEIMVAQEEITSAETEVSKAEANADEALRKFAGSEEEARRTSNMSGTSGTAEGNIATELISEAVLGGSAKMIKTGMDMLSDIDPGAGTGLKTFESDKKAMMRKPGLYANNTSTTELNQSNAGKAWKGLTGKDLFGDVNAASDSITKNTESMARTAQVNATNISAQAHQVKQLTFSKQMANEQKYNNAVAIQMNRGGPAPGGMGGGSAGQQTQSHDLAMAPRGPSKDMLTEEETGAMA